MRCLPLLLSAPLLLFAGGLAAEEPVPPRQVVAGRHVHVGGDVELAVLEEAVAVADALVPLLEEHFDATLPAAAKPLRVEIHTGHDRFRKAVVAEGGDDPVSTEIGGYTPRRSLVSHVRLQRYRFDTRRLVLHELTHQVQDKLFSEHGPGTDAEWHREGLAEHFGWHIRSAGGLKVGQMDAVAAAGAWSGPEVAAQRVTRGALDPWAVVTGKGEPAFGYADGLCLVDALLQAPDPALRAAFRTWEREAWRRRDATARFEAQFGPRREALAAAVKDRWHGRRLSFKVLSGKWDQEGECIRGFNAHDDVGRSDVSAGVSPESVEQPSGGVGTRAAARLRPPNGPGGEAGVDLTFVGQGRVELSASGNYISMQVRRGAEGWPLMGLGQSAGPASGVNLVLSVTEEGVTARMGFGSTQTDVEHRFSFSELGGEGHPPFDPSRGVTPGLFVEKRTQVFEYVNLTR